MPLAYRPCSNYLRTTLPEVWGLFQHSVGCLAGTELLIAVAPAAARIRQTLEAERHRHGDPIVGVKNNLNRHKTGAKAQHDGDCGFRLRRVAVWLPRNAQSARVEAG